jgi:DNA adenine methylase
MGEMSGSPVGGKNQTGAWKYDCRWKPDLICKRIREVAEALRGCGLSAWDYQTVLAHARDDEFVFIDPPYVDAGAKCYKHSFTPEDHVTLAQRVRKLKCSWAITYDYHPLVVELYAPWAEVYDLEFKYFMSSAYRAGEAMKTGKELLICKV